MHGFMEGFESLLFFSTYIQMACALNKGLLDFALVANENAICIACN